MINKIIKKIERSIFGSIDSLSSKGIVRLDTNRLERYAKKDKDLQLYYEGLEIANKGQRDTFLKQCRFSSLMNLVQFTLQKNVEGDLAECGCYKGHSSYLIASKIKASGTNKNLHVFDSFEGGLSERGSKDESTIKRTAEQLKKERNYFASDFEEVNNNLSKFDFVNLYKGWIPERFNEVSNKTFSFVHLDVDLYQPTLDSLNFFYPRLSKNGVIVIDDYGYSNFSGAKTSVDEFLANENCSMFYELPTGGAFILK